MTLFPNTVRRYDYQNPDDLSLINHLPSRNDIDHGLFIAAMTFTEMPGLLSDLSEFALDIRGVSVFQTFRDRLVALSHQIGLWNEHRDEYRVCDPKILEISVAV